PHGARERDRQSDPARDQAVRQSAHGAPHARAYRLGRFRNHAQGNQHGRGGRQAPRDDVAHRERPAYRRRSPGPPRVRSDAPVRERVMNHLILPLMLCVQLAPAAEVAGVKVDERVKLGSSELQLNGTGIRTRLFFKVYVGALYLPERKSSAPEVLALRGAKRVSMALLRDLTARQLTDALEEG